MTEREIHVVLYDLCMVLVVVTVFPNLYLALRAPWKPKAPQEKRPPRNRISSKYLLRAAIACLLAAIALTGRWRIWVP